MERLYVQARRISNDAASIVDAGPHIGLFVECKDKSSGTYRQALSQPSTVRRAYDELVPINATMGTATSITGRRAAVKTG